MTKQRKRYTPEFRSEAVALVEQRGLTMAQVSRDLGVAETTLWRWVHDAQQAKARPTAPSPSASESDELKRLRAENAVLREERDILKKATAFFAKESR